MRLKLHSQTHSQNRFKNPYFSNRRISPERWYGRIVNDWFAYIGIMVIVVGMSVYVIRAKHILYIEYISISGNQYVTVEDVAQPVREVLATKKWLALPRRIYPFADEEYIRDHIQTALSKKFAIESVTVEKIFPDEISIIIKERIPGFIYITDQNSYYYVDLNGYITEQKNLSELDQHFPRIRDHNQRSIAIGQQIVNQQIIQAMTSLNERFTTSTGLNISEYAVKETACYKKDYVAEKIFADEIEGTANEEIKSQKKDILQRLEEGDISVDQSLDLLEEVKRTEAEATNEESSNTNSGNQAFLRLAAEYKDTDCNFTAVIQDVGVVTQEGPTIWFDSNIDIELQLDNLIKVLDSKINDLSKIEYVDVRFPDRAYFR